MDQPKNIHQYNRPLEHYKYGKKIQAGFHFGHLPIFISIDTLFTELK